MTKAEVTVLHVAAEVDIVAEKENETIYLLNGANTSSVKVDSDGLDAYVNLDGNDSVNGVVVESGDNCIVEEDHEVKSESDSVTITMNQQEVDIVAEKKNETRYFLNGANTSSVKVGSGSLDVYVNGNDSDNGVVVESDGNCIVEEDHEVKSESDSVTITMNQQEADIVVEEDHKVTISMNQQEGEKPVDEKGEYVEEKSGDGDDCLAKETVQDAAVVIDSSVVESDSASESSIVIDSSLKQSDGKVDCLVETDVNPIVIDSVTTDDDATHIEIKTDSDSSKSSTTVETDANFVVGSISFVVDVQSNQYNGNLADSEEALQLVDKSLDVVSGLKSETNVSSDSISVVASNSSERTCGVTNGGIEFGSFDDEAEREHHSTT
ncbi:hypothetical protein Gotur_015355 [Gossypium turneri]